MNAFKNLIIGTAVLTVGAMAALPVNVLATSPKAHVPGNNGTLKVHEKGTPVATESNDPKVCEFNFEGYGFDKGQRVVVEITTQGGGNDKSVVKSVSLPAANDKGYMESSYITIANGHYKTTAYGKDVHGNIDYNMELKAKSKVIKVECNKTSETPAKPVTPTKPSTPTPDVRGDTTTSTGGVGASTSTGGTVLAEAASTTKSDVKGATAPAVIAATGANPLQILFNTIFAGLGAYTAMLRRK
jgi:hypothetical protein